MRKISVKKFGELLPALGFGLLSPWKIKIVFVIAVNWFILLGVWSAGCDASVASVSPVLQEAKQKAEAKGFVFETRHDDLVAKAKEEGKLRVLSSFDPDTFKQMAKAFMQKYPGIEVEVQEITGTEAEQRFLLELQSDTVKDWDVFHLPEDFYNQYTGHAKKFDIMGMAENRVLGIPTGMIDPHHRTIVAEGSALSSPAYNKKLLSPDKVPDTWEDFLKPEFKGHKFIVDIRPHGFAALAAGLGSEWMVSYARKIREQDPIWTRGQTRALTAMVAGEYALHQLTNYHSCVRAAEKDLTKVLVCKLIEPIPVRLMEPEAVISTAAHPYAALLWLEFQATPEGQRIIDEYEPLKSSIYAPGSALEKVTQGKKLSINNWDTYEQTPKWMKMTIEAFGFPKGQKLK